LGEHHLLELLGWNPQAIILLSALYKSNTDLTLVDLYQMIVKQKLLEDTQTTISGRQEITQSLQITIRVQIEELFHWDRASYKFLQLLSLLPTFNSERDLNHYWQFFLRDDPELGIEQTSDVIIQ
jgi:hypothetical protein